jgi:hypothetical protein
MKRDDDLVRNLLLDLEMADRVITGQHVVEGYSQEQVSYHLALILQAGLAQGPRPTYSVGNADPTIPAAVAVLRLTNEGHDFISTIRSDTVWERTKLKVKEVGGDVSLSILKEIGLQVSRSLLGLS